MDDTEAGKETTNVNKFFKDVENVRDDMKCVETLYNRLYDSNEECKKVQNAKKVKELRAKTDGDVTKVLKRIKIIKQKLEALEKANGNSHNVPGCGTGSSFTDRTRTSVAGPVQHFWWPEAKKKMWHLS
ncbi:syntaxin [Cardamine amara subsp. amara]|uniref:Syntaxin n=1 Tax=Cardamine amara subsp. amara TaxID=228776 RepID=A0ABD0ZQA3_CARAN